MLNNNKLNNEGDKAETLYWYITHAQYPQDAIDFISEKIKEERNKMRLEFIKECEKSRREWRMEEAKNLNPARDELTPEEKEAKKLILQGCIIALDELINKYKV